MTGTSKTEITSNEKLQLIGLLVLAKANNERLKDITNAVIAITGETDDMGHGMDAVFGDYTADELLDRLDIKVIDSPVKEKHSEET